MTSRRRPLPTDDRSPRLIDRAGLAELIGLLWQEGFRVVGPTVSQGAIVYDEVRGLDELPIGWTDEQSAGRYRLTRRDDDALFGYNVGPHSWKQFLFPPRATVALAERTGEGWEFADPPRDGRPLAFLGVRACELAAMAVQDRTFLGGPFVDPIYAERRAQAFVIAVNCTQAAGTCFCPSMNAGPRCTAGFDLALTEIDNRLTVEIGTDRGAAFLAKIPTRKASAAALRRAESRRQAAVEQMTRRLDTHDIRNMLLENLEHPRWDDVAARCLSCTNCTMVCPTCFCSSVVEVTDLDGRHVERERQWDSCFNVAFSDINGGPVRTNIRARYRQWLTHKLASWIDQFGVSGCVGCGRCIAWCPVGIDLTEEVAALREVAS